MEYKDYYRIMGVKRDATQDEIKRTYRKLARKYHPDVSKADDAEERFKEVGEAYEVLKDPEKRAAYDQLGADWKAGQDFRPPPDWDAGFEFSGGGYTAGGGGVHSDFFEELFGQQYRQAGAGAGRRTFHVRGEDHHARVLVDLEDSFTNYPNPFAAGRDQCRISFYLAADARVTLEVYTLGGSRVKRLLDGVALDAGLHDDVAWDGRNGDGRVVRNGTYLLRISVDGPNGGEFLRKLAVVR